MTDLNLLENSASGQAIFQNTEPIRPGHYPYENTGHDFPHKKFIVVTWYCIVLTLYFEDLERYGGCATYTL
jgi:hypothetical protein